MRLAYTFFSKAISVAGGRQTADVGSPGEAKPRVVVPKNSVVTIVSANTAGLDDTRCKLKTQIGSSFCTPQPLFGNGDSAATFLEHDPEKARPALVMRGVKRFQQDRAQSESRAR